MSRVVLMREDSIIDPFCNSFKTHCQRPLLKIFLVSAN
jgi:hypothetical protein